MSSTSSRMVVVQIQDEALRRRSSPFGTEAVTVESDRRARRVDRSAVWTSQGLKHVQALNIAAIQPHWVGCLSTGRDAETPGADNLEALAQAAYRSAATSAPQQTPSLTRSEEL